MASLFEWSRSLSTAEILDIMKNLKETDIVPDGIVITLPEDVRDNTDCDYGFQETNNSDNLNHNQLAAKGKDNEVRPPAESDKQWEEDDDILLAILVKKLRITEDEERKDVHNQLVAKSMRKNEFKEICSVCHAVDNDNLNETDKIEKICLLIDAINRQFLKYARMELNGWDIARVFLTKDDKKSVVPGRKRATIKYPSVGLRRHLMATQQTRGKWQLCKNKTNKRSDTCN
ncbi:hypothetical protein ILUMI_14861, partial [Ignelater luminosus]